MAAFYSIVKEVDDIAGQHEIIVENSNANVYEALRKLQHDLHKEKKAVSLPCHYHERDVKLLQPGVRLALSDCTGFGHFL